MMLSLGRIPPEMHGHDDNALMAPNANSSTTEPIGLILVLF